MIYSDQTARRSADKPRFTTGIVVLLVLLTLFNVVSLVLLTGAWIDAASRGSDWDDDELALPVLGVILQAVAIGGLVAAWFKRLWGAQLYLAVQAMGAVLTLIVGSGEQWPLRLVPVLLAAILLALCTTAWRPK